MLWKSHHTHGPCPESRDGPGLMGSRSLEARSVGATALMNDRLHILQLSLGVRLEMRNVSCENEMKLSCAADLVAVNLRHSSQIESFDGPIEPLHVGKLHHLVLRCEQLTAKLKVLMQGVDGVEYPRLHHSHLVRNHGVTSHDFPGDVGRKLGEKPHLNHVDGNKLVALRPAKDAGELDVVQHDPVPVIQCVPEALAVRKLLDLLNQLELRNCGAIAGIRLWNRDVGGLERRWS